MAFVWVLKWVEVLVLLLEDDLMVNELEMVWGRERGVRLVV
jgi:hypothetical protein